MNEYPLTELMHAIDRECKSGKPKVKSARIYTKAHRAARTGFKPKSHPLTALTAFPEQGVVTIDGPPSNEGKDIVGYAIEYFTVAEIERIEIFEED